MTLPVGSIVASVLTLADFKKQVVKGETWELADGLKLGSGTLARLIAAGGEYSELNPGNVPTKPNLLGVFLRGCDTADSTKTRNPDGRVKVGMFQDDAFKSHHHNHPRPKGDDGSREGGGRDGWYSHSTDETESFGGPETRPKNVTVNFFIRVN